MSAPKDPPVPVLVPAVSPASMLVHFSPFSTNPVLVSTQEGSPDPVLASASVSLSPTSTGPVLVSASKGFHSLTLSFFQVRFPSQRAR